MKSSITLFVTNLFVLAGLLSAAPAGVSIHKLNNGMEVLLIENRALPMVGVNVVVKTGSSQGDLPAAGLEDPPRPLKDLSDVGDGKGETGILEKVPGPVRRKGEEQLEILPVPEGVVEGAAAAPGRQLPGRFGKGDPLSMEHRPCARSRAESREILVEAVGEVDHGCDQAAQS